MNWNLKGSNGFKKRRKQSFNNVKVENTQEEIKGQNQTGVNTSDSTGENSTDQNSVPGNSGDGSSNTDDNGNMYTE